MLRTEGLQATVVLHALSRSWFLGSTNSGTSPECCSWIGFEEQRSHPELPWQRARTDTSPGCAVLRPFRFGARMRSPQTALARPVHSGGDSR